MGTHHIKGSLTPQMLNDPDFNKDDPNLDAAGLDDVFDPDKPEVLQYDSNSPGAKLVGFGYYAPTDTGLPPEGFPNNQDWWHIHPKICFRKADAVMDGFNITDAACAAEPGSTSTCPTTTCCTSGCSTTCSSGPTCTRRDPCLRRRPSTTLKTPATSDGGRHGVSEDDHRLCARDPGRGDVLLAAARGDSQPPFLLFQHRRR
ncbi:MAG: hypothetical protein R2700_16085 [Solirubrobacterales bacterium]